MALKTSPFTQKVHSGLSIHTSAVRGATVTTDESVVGTAEFVFPEPILTDDIKKPDDLVAALIQVKNQAKFTSPYVAVCFPEKYAFSRTYQLPKLAVAEIDEAVTWQIENIFPFSKEDIYVDWKLLELTEEGTQVLVTAVAKNLLDHFRLCIEKAGLFPISFEPSASAISRLLPQDKPAPAFILELETHSVCTTLVLNGTSAATSTFNLDPTHNSQMVLAQIKTSMQAMTQKYLKVEATDSASPQVNVYISGEKAAAGLTQNLTQSLGMPVQLPSDLKVTPAFHLAVTAARTNILPPQSEKTINLLPTQLQQHYSAQLNKNQAKSSLSSALYLTAPAVILCLITYAITYFYLGSVNKAIAAQKASSTVATIAGLNLAQVNQESQRYLTLFPHKTSPESLINTIMSTFSDQVTVHSLIYDAKLKTFTLAGMATNRVDLINLKTLLEETGEFDQITLPLSSLENTQNANFTITLKVKTKP